MPRLRLVLAAAFGWLALYAAAAHAMSFAADRFCATETRCVPALLASGTIDDKTPGAFDEAIARNPDTQAVVLSSKGGSLVGGLRLGLQIRRFQLDTLVNDDCFSACAYAFLGGVERTVTPDGRIGVHQFRAGNRDLDAGNVQKITAVLGSYFDRMGVDRRLLDTALLTPTSQVVIFTPDQLKALKADNRGQVFALWRLETTAQGQKVALWNGLYPDPDVRRTLTIGIARISGVTRLLVIVRSSASMNAFADEMPLDLQIKEQRWTLKPMAAWAPVNKGRQMIYTLPPAALAAMQTTNAREMTLTARWPALSQNDQPMSLRVGLSQLPAVLRSLDLVD